MTRRILAVAGLVAATVAATDSLAAQGSDVVPVDSLQVLATVVLNDSGLVVRFPRSMSPDSITRDMLVPDHFSGYEWRVIFLDRNDALVTAFVIAPDDTLAIHRYRTIAQAYDAGSLRRCERNLQVLECDHLARGLVRDADGRLEIAILDPSWLSLAFNVGTPMVRLVVKRARDVLWAEDVPVLVRLP